MSKIRNIVTFTVPTYLVQSLLPESSHTTDFNEFLLHLTKLKRLPNIIRTHDRQKLLRLTQATPTSHASTTTTLLQITQPDPDVYYHEFMHYAKKNETTCNPPSSLPTLAATWIRFYDACKSDWNNRMLTPRCTPDSDTILPSIQDYPSLLEIEHALHHDPPSYLPRPPFASTTKMHAHETVKLLYSMMKALHSADFEHKHPTITLPCQDQCFFVATHTQASDETTTTTSIAAASAPILRNSEPTTNEPPNATNDNQDKQPKEDLVVCNLGPEYLQITHPHPRDKFIQFEEQGHQYKVDFDHTGQFETKQLLSSTGFVHSYFPKFDEDEVIVKMVMSRNWNKHNPYYYMTTDEIKAQWESTRNRASNKGTFLHFVLEKHCNGFDVHLSGIDDMVELTQFKKWHATVFAPKLVPYRTEFRLFTDKASKLCGMVDLLAIAPDHLPPEQTDGVLHLTMIDWKFSKQIRTHNRYANGSGPCSHLSDCNFVHYSLQQNLYKYVLENYYAQTWTYNGHAYQRVIIDNMQLAVFHTNHAPSGRVVDIPDMQPVIAQMVEERTATLAKIQQKVQQQPNPPCQTLQKRQLDVSSDNDSTSPYLVINAATGQQKPHVDNTSATKTQSTIRRCPKRKKHQNVRLDY